MAQRHWPITFSIGALVCEHPPVLLKDYCRRLTSLCTTLNKPEKMRSPILRLVLERLKDQRSERQRNQEAPSEPVKVLIKLSKMLKFLSCMRSG
jgi:hypothetical protein